MEALVGKLMDKRRAKIVKCTFDKPEYHLTLELITGLLGRY